MKETLRYLFQQKFNRDEYRRVVLQNLLHAQKLLREPQFLEETNEGDRIYGLGYLHDADGKEIGLYYTDVVNGDVRRKRVGFSSDDEALCEIWCRCGYCSVCR